MFRVLKTWQVYEKLCVPPDATVDERAKLKDAFFAGSATIFQGMLTAVSEGSDEPTADDERFMGELQAELDAFGQQLDTKHLGRVLRGREH
jgi:hypothetical protein